MATDTEQLVVHLEARIRDFERNFDRANRTAQRQFTAVEARARQSAQRVEHSFGDMTARVQKQFAIFGRGAAGLIGAGGLLSAGGALAAIRGAVTDLATTSAEAQRAGLGVEAFQELRYAAGQSRVNVDALTDGMKELQLRADEFIVTGKGSAAEAFKRIGLTPAMLKTQLADPAELLNEIINRVGALDRAARIRILDELFGGTGGEQFIRFLEHGRDGINGLRREARETGNVLDKEVLDKAVEIDRRFNRLTATVGTQLKGAILEVVDALSEFLAKLPGGEVPIERIGERSTAITREIVALEGQLGDARRRAAETGWAMDRERIAGIERRIDALKAEDRLLQQRGQAAVAERDRRKAFDLPPATGGEYRGGKSVADSAATVAKAYGQIQRSALAQIATLETEIAATGRSTAEKARLRLETDLLNSAQRRGTVLTAAQRDEVAQLAQRYGTLSANLEDAKRGQERLVDLQQQLGNLGINAIEGLIEGTKSFADVLDDAWKLLLRIALQSAFLGQGPLGGLFGAPATGGKPGGLMAALFGGMGFAEGGLVRGPGTSRSDSILARLSDGEFVINADAAKRHRSLLEALNAGMIPGFAEGGAVTDAAAENFVAGPRTRWRCRYICCVRRYPRERQRRLAGTECRPCSSGRKADRGCSARHCRARTAESDASRWDAKKITPSRYLL